MKKTQAKRTYSSDSSHGPSPLYFMWEHDSMIRDSQDWQKWLKKNIQPSGQLQKWKRGCVQEHGPSHSKPVHSTRFYIQDIGQSHQPPLFSTMDRAPDFAFSTMDRVTTLHCSAPWTKTQRVRPKSAPAFVQDHGQRHWVAPLDAFSTVARDRLGCVQDHGCSGYDAGTETVVPGSWNDLRVPNTAQRCPETRNKAQMLNATPYWGGYYLLKCFNWAFNAKLLLLHPTLLKRQQMIMETWQMSESPM